MPIIPAITPIVKSPGLFTAPTIISWIVNVAAMLIPIATIPPMTLINRIPTHFQKLIFFHFEPTLSMFVSAAIEAFAVRSAFRFVSQFRFIRAIARAVVVFDRHHSPGTLVPVITPCAIGVFVLPVPAAFFPQFFRLHSHFAATTFPPALAV